MPRHRILSIVDLTTSYGRSVVNGMYRFAKETPGVETIRGIGKNEDIIGYLNDLAMEFTGVVAQIATPDLLQGLRPHKLPVVNISNRFAGLEYPQVITDEWALGRNALQYYAQLGHRRFGFLGIFGHNYSAERGAGFTEAARDLGCECIQSLPEKPGFSYIDYIHEFADRLQKSVEKPVAVLAANDNIAWRLLQYCQSIGLRVPQDVAILGVDNDPLICETCAPTLSSIPLAGEDIGYEAARMIVAMSRNEVLAQRILVNPREVAVRESTGSLAAADQELCEIVAWIRARAATDIHVRDVLRQFPMSRRSLEMRFRKSLRVSPSEMIRRERITHASRLLADGRMPIKEVAFTCGFGDPRQFSKIFKRVTKKAPSEYRNNRTTF